MKHGRKPTMKEKLFMDKLGYLPDAYMVIKNTPNQLILISKHRLTQVVIDKECVNL